MKRIVCVVEGHGEVAAVPNLVARILGYLGANSWRVDQDPIRAPRSRLVDQGTRSAVRGIEDTLEIALARKANAVVILVDADDDCPATWGPASSIIVAKRIPGTAIMAVREYEAWLLWAQAPDLLANKGVHPNRVRDAKGAMAKVVTGYKPSTHQLAETRKLPIDTVRSLSPSFDKLVRDIGGLVGHAAPTRKHPESGYRRLLGGDR